VKLRVSSCCFLYSVKPHVLTVRSTSPRIALERYLTELYRYTVFLISRLLCISQVFRQTPTAAQLVKKVPWELELCYRVQESLSLRSLLTQFYPVHTLTPYSIKMSLNTEPIIQSMSNSLFPQDFPSKILQYECLIFSQACYMLRIIPSDLIVAAIFCENNSL
jgi:hypothetical protein